MSRLTEIEKKLGRYLTAPELENVEQGATSHQLTPQELRAVKRIWPHVQLEFKLEGGRTWHHGDS